ncbi:MAG: hypothetical protein AMJ78_08310, partial [Omnitrophica WOR_2 bacterium SM23_29]
MAIFNHKVITSIEITDRHIKLLQISAKGSDTKVIACVFKELSATEPEACAAILQGILEEYNIKPKDLVLTISRQSVTIRNIRLPSQNLREIDEMVGFQAVKQIPYPKEEIAYGYNIYGIDSEGYSKIILVICHRDAIERPIEILKDCGLNPTKITLSSFGLINWFILNTELREKSKGSPIILVDCDIGTSDIAIIYNNKLIYTRGLTFGFAEGPKYYE